jgi:sulfur carrier protein ThiS adenylyltransferase
LALDLTDRDIRQRDIIPREKLDLITGLVIGVGAVGRQVALQLATIGVPRLVLVDHDTIAVENLAAQGFYEGDIDVPKVVATSAICRCINSAVDVVTHQKRFDKDIEIPMASPEHRKAVFCCVDSMAARKDIWKLLEFEHFFVDTRMAAEVARIFCVTSDDPASAEYYPTTLFDDTQAYAASCTSKTTIYCANLCAALAVSQMTKWLRNIPTDSDVTFNIMTTELEHVDAQIAVKLQEA